MRVVFPFKPNKLTIAIFGCAVLFGCSGDFEPTSRIVVPAETVPNPPVPPATINAQLSLAGSSLTYFDLFDGESVASTTFESTTNPLTGESSALTADVELDPNNDSPQGLLVILDIPSGTEYFDPISRQTVVLDEDKQLYALSNSSSLSIYPTPYSTLATYRALARSGWFFENSQLPTASEFAELIQQDRANFFAKYSAAINEIQSVFGAPGYIGNLTEFEDPDNFGELVAGSNSVFALNYLLLTAQFRVYADKFQTDSPFFDLAQDLSVDFLDGDIDGKTLAGIEPTLATTLVETSSNQAVIFDPQAEFVFDEIYLNQQGTLQSFEALASVQAEDLITELNPTTTVDDLREFFNSEDDSEPQSQSRDRDVDSYADFRSAALGPFAGVGDKTFGFGIPTDPDQPDQQVTQKQFIGLPIASQSASPLSSVIAEVQGIYGKYQSNDCSLTIGPNGVVDLTSGSTQYTAVLDRDAGDKIIKLSDDSYYLYASTALQAGSTSNRVIQISVSANQVTSVSTAIATDPGTNPLNNTEASCSF